ncbi:ABC transporter ATP-binding protein [Achromobacter sp.]|uniref:ABC transporter ATP-binding protein n=1 Tax=Achromobacter sp. TaxID=134375 RepID=UPI002583A2DD|nr:ABC transporter ATP-binding protein [Achromobacter sp.]
MSSPPSTHPLRFVWSAVAGFRRHHALMLLAPAWGALYIPVCYYAIKRIVDALADGRAPAWPTLAGPIALWLAADLSTGLLWRLSTFAAWRSEPWVRRGIVVAAVARILSYGHGFFQNAAVGGLVSKVKALSDGYDDLWNQCSGGMAFLALAMLASAANLAWIDVRLGLIVLGWLALALALNLRMGRAVVRLVGERSEARHRATAECADILGNAAAVKMFAARQVECDRLARSMDGDLVAKEVASLKLDFRVGLLNDLLGLLFLAAMLAAVWHLRAGGHISIGSVVQVFGLMFNLSLNLFLLIQEYQNLVHKLGSLHSALSVLDADRDEYGGLSLRAAAPGVEFQRLCFRHADGHAVFDGLDLAVAPGEKLGIVGETGAGKTTLVHLLLKHLRPQSGRVLVGGCDIAAVDADCLRRAIAVIPQDISLFHRDLRANIAYGRPDADDDAIERAARRAHAHGFISRLPAGYATRVGERGIKLSGGQRQRIGIARALLKDAPILVLDEATSSLDSRTETLIQDALRELLRGKTVLAIAHRLSTLKDMDRIVVLDRGRVVESGTHATLMADARSRYAALWAAQAGRAPDAAERAR